MLLLFWLIDLGLMAIGSAMIGAAANSPLLGGGVFVVAYGIYKFRFE